MADAGSSGDDESDPYDVACCANCKDVGDREVWSEDGVDDEKKDVPFEGDKLLRMLEMVRKSELMLMSMAISLLDVND